MPVVTILLLRHGHRLAWSLDPTTGTYTSSHPFPTRLPADPPLASHGVSQSIETGKHLATQLLPLAREGRLRVYSSLFYRCMQTLRPFVEELNTKLAQEGSSAAQIKVRGELGVGEWFGHAPFTQPRPATPQRLQQEFFPWVDTTYSSLIVPDEHGERIETLHLRIKHALAAIVQDVNQEFSSQGKGDEEVTILICGHAAQIIASGRALTGWKAAEREEQEGGFDEEDFLCFTCGISRFERRLKVGAGRGEAEPSERSKLSADVEAEAEGETNENPGIWTCTQNSDCSHLSTGEERGWKFHGDESFDSYAPVSDGSFGGGGGGVGAGSGEGAKL